jgi:hypothetical protein
MVLYIQALHPGLLPAHVIELTALGRQNANLYSNGLGVS